MAYDAIVRGARGILYWGSHAVEKDSPFYGELLALVSELRDLQSVLAAPDADLNVTTAYEPTLGSVDRDIIVLAKDHGNKPWLFVVNEWSDSLAGTLSGLESLNGTSYRERDSGEVVEVTDGKITLHIPGHSAHILEPVD